MSVKSTVIFYTDGFGVYNSRRGDVMDVVHRAVRFYPLDKVSTASRVRLSLLTYGDNTETHVHYETGAKVFTPVTRWIR